MIKFDAIANNEKQSVDILWTTATEIKNDYFTIERPSDGTSWTDIANVKGAGTSESTIDYTSSDSNPLHGRSYYQYEGQVSIIDAKGVIMTQSALQGTMDIDTRDFAPGIYIVKMITATKMMTKKIVVSH